MNILAHKEEVGLRLIYLDTVQGEAKFRAKNYSKINPQAEDQNIYRTGQLISQLQTKEIHSLQKVEVSSLEVE